MLPFVNVFGHEIAMYSVMIILGICIGVIVAIFHFSKYYDMKKEDIFYCILFGIIGMVLGAKLLYIITNIPYIIQNISNLNKEMILSLLQSGFVFYGGLIGGVLGIYIYTKLFKLSFKTMLLIIIPVVPLIHSIGRIGCFFAGCCYGMEYEGIGHVVFKNTPFINQELLGVPLFPSQLVESFCNLLIFIVICLTYKKFKGSYKTIGLYCVLYSLVRFTLEFFRGDAVRGFVLGISTSQWISVMIFIIGIGLFIKENKKIPKNTWNFPNFLV